MRASGGILQRRGHSFAAGKKREDRTAPLLWPRARQTRAVPNLPVYCDSPKISPRDRSGFSLSQYWRMRDFAVCRYNREQPGEQTPEAPEMFFEGNERKEREQEMARAGR